MKSDDEKLEMDGWWTIPGKENIQLRGILKFSPDQTPLLSLSGRLEEIIGLNLWHNAENFLVIGETLENEKVTLQISSFISQREFSRGNTTITEIVLRVQFIFVGVHFLKEEDILFESVLIQYSNLEQSLLIHQIDGRSFRNWKKDKLTIDYTFGTPVRIEIDNKYIIEILTNPDLSIDALKCKIDSKNIVYFKIQSLVDKSLHAYLRVKSILQDLLNFIIKDPVDILSFEGYKSNDTTLDLNYIRILYRSTRSSKMNKPTVNPTFFFDDDNLGELNSLIIRWFEFEDRMNIAYDLYFGVIYNVELYVSQRFLMIVQAIEEYHRIVKKDKTKLNDAQKKLYDKILPHISNLSDNSDDFTSEDIEELEVWLKNILLQTIKGIIEDIYQDFIEILPNISIKVGTKKCFANKVRSYRNKLSHGSLSSEDVNDHDLFWTYKDLQLLLQLCFVSNLGFSKEKIKELYQVEELSNIMTQKKTEAKKYFDEQTEVVYRWCSELTDRCDFPLKFCPTTEILLKIVSGVQSCIDREDKDLIIFEKYKLRFLESVFQINKPIMRNLNRSDVLGISLALWSGCVNGAKVISDETNGGPNIHQRGLVMQIVEKISSERPLYAKGVELSPLWKLNKQEFDINFEDAVEHFHIRKYEVKCKGLIHHSE